MKNLGGIELDPEVGMITTVIIVGVGDWTATKVTKLVACPHMGDYIVVDDRAIHCEQERRDFGSKEQAEQFFDS